MSEYTIINTEDIEVGRFHIIKHMIQTNEGSLQPYTYISMRPGVVVIPTIGDRVVMIKQYRLAVDSWEWEFPAGIIDFGEEPEFAAIRELEEETGYKTNKIRSFGYCYSSQGTSNEKIFLYTIECGEKKNVKHDKTEKIECYLMPFDRVNEMIQQNEFHHSMGIAAWYKFIKSE